MRTPIRPAVGLDGEVVFPPEGFVARQAWWVGQAMRDEFAPDFHQWVALIVMVAFAVMLLAATPVLLPIKLVQKSLS